MQFDHTNDSEADDDDFKADDDSNDDNYNAIQTERSSSVWSRQRRLCELRASWLLLFDVGQHDALYNTVDFVSNECQHDGVLRHAREQVCHGWLVCQCLFLLDDDARVRTRQ